jgi:hypothetical protein
MKRPFEFEEGGSPGGQRRPRMGEKKGLMGKTHLKYE